MRNVPEYDLSNPSSWVVLRRGDVIGDIDFKWFSDQLIRLAGLNPHGEPNLALRWAVDYQDPMTTDDYPKYYLSTNEQVLIGRGYKDDSGQFVTVDKIEDIPAGKLYLPIYSQTHLGERRFIVEIWRSPEFLERSGRYVEGSRRDPETGEILLREFPRQGCYDCFFRIERADRTYHPPDGEALEGIQQLWAKNLRSFAEKDAELRRAREREAKESKKRRREIWHPDNQQPEEMIA